MRAYLALILVAITPAFGATRYVDFSTGADSNAGTSKAAPWKHAPGMTGCASNCSSFTPAAGDSIILKGGVTWDRTAFGWSIPTSGTTASPIYYGVDTTWYTGTNSGTVNTSGATVTWASGNAFQMNGSWTGGAIAINGTAYTISSVVNPSVLILTTSAGTQTGVAYSNSLFKRPILDAQFLVQGQMDLTNISNVTIDSLEFTGTIMKTPGDESIYVQTTNGHITLENLDVHNWARCTGSGAPSAACTGAMTDNSGSAGGIYFNLFGGLSGTANVVSGSNIGNPENGGDIGACTRGAQTLLNNYIHDCSQACLHGCGLVHDNIVQNVGQTFDGDTHTNVFYSDCFDGQCSGGLSTFTAYLYNNWIIDSQGNDNATGGAAYPNPGTSGVTSSVTYYVFNNVVSCVMANGCNLDIADEIDPFGAGGQSMNVHDWNNTYVVESGGTCVNVVSRGGISMNIVDVRNLQCISPSATTFNSDGTTSPSSSNLLNQTVTVANSQGYVAPTWKPTSKTGSTVGTGLDLSANCSGTLAALCNSTTLGGTLSPSARTADAWDIGAYAFSSDSQPPPSLFSGSAIVPGSVVFH